MATTTTAGTVLNRLLTEVVDLGLKFTGTATNATATVTTSATRIAAMGSEAVTTRYQGRTLWIPSAASADQLRTILGHSTSDSTGTVTITVAGNYGATYTSVDMYILATEPDTIFDLQTQALKDLSFKAEVPLRHGPEDADMQTAGTSNWTGTATLAKVTDTDNVWIGAQALEVTDGGAGGQYAQSGLQVVGEGKQMRVHAIAKGDCTLRIVDSGGNTVDEASFDTDQWAYVTWQLSLPSNVTQFRLRLISNAAAGVTYWQGAWFVRENERRFRLPSWMGNRFTIGNLAIYSYFDSLGGNDGGEMYLADSAIPRSLRKGTDWQHFKRTADAHVRWVQLTRCEPYWPMFLLVSCSYFAPYGASVSITDLSSTSVCPEDKWVAQTKQLLGAYYPEDWPQLESEGRSEVVALEITDEDDSGEPERINGFTAAFRR